ncbi:MULTISPECIES: hypothetical protein [unclassified Mesorhizobium]|uniref:hypothetical protein n=1 Tax=unclassified Mesorhizobium TaxID=325217 RepID=UPI00112C947D|nr:MULTISPECIES: hypothetical protein [unclassified Mesorhizobium]TPJ43912.1 hypothetical protein FJ437_19755 [Mesorhizobium sp. B2-6-6]MCA0002244.1 hypothetical protein [Mesorhizobium sp. B264B2A]MCA0008945.1 hypothetical protein [Mesorhizobium sp. B264B1B]MCA0017058.1 hypothetical protein [Mesorhizobium sp. B264B1A]TPJ55048.1 hypothetical protein FJ462_32935 [Mesorhizobium sp. B2-6-7]
MALTIHCDANGRKGLQFVNGTLPKEPETRTWKRAAQSSVKPAIGDDSDLLARFEMEKSSGADVPKH